MHTSTAPEALKERSLDIPAKRPSTLRAHVFRMRSVVAAAAISGATLVAADGSMLWKLVRAIAALSLGLGVVLVRRGRGRPAALATSAFGLVTGSVGLGLLPHLIDGGDPVIAVASLAATVSGLTLLVAGAAGLLRHLGWPGRVLGAVVVAIATGSVGQVVVVPVLATNVPPSPIGATPADRGLDYETATLTAPDGVALAGWYIPSRNGAAVLLRHGAGSTRSNVLPQATVLAAHGYGVLMMDARGHGESGGRAMDLGWYGDRDIAAGITFLVARSDVDAERIGVVGSSMGGEEAIGASGANPMIQLVVADGATGRTAADKAWFSDAYGLRGAVQELIEHAQTGLTGMLTDAPRPVALRDAVEASGETRYLLIVGGAVPNEGRAAAHIRSIAPDRVEVWTVPGVGHTGGLQAVPDEWERRVTTFLERNL